MPVIFALLLLFAVVTQAQSMESPQPNTADSVKGDVLYWEGEELVVKEISGRQVRLRVTPETKIEGVAGGRLKAGDKIAAQIKPDGLALSIVLQIPDSGTGVIPPGSR